MLTDTAIKKLKPVGKDYQKADGEGLVLVVRAAGEKSWRYEFRLNGKKQKYTYGNYPEFSLDDARSINRVARKLVEQGRHPSTMLDDPVTKKQIIDGASFKELEASLAERQQQAALASIPTFGQLAELYWQEVERTWKNPEKQFSLARRHLLPKLGHIRINEIDVAMVRELIYDIRERIGTPTAHVARDWANRIFDYGVEHNLCASNPASLVRAKRVGDKVKRKRWLKSSEIRRYLTDAYRLNSYRGHKLGLHLLMITGVRIGELVGAKWNEIDLEQAEWLIRSDRMKAENDHYVPLPAQAVSMFQELKQLSADDEFVFPSDRTSTGHIQKETLRYFHQQVCASANIADYLPHDHRHTISTHLRERGFNPEIVETTLAHKLPGVAGVYSHAQYREQRRAMLQDWADYLDSLVTEQVVVQANFRQAV
ncbi:tyrosine-type recombinase/integrase [Methylomonas sp. MK1]|uniref:tyrosine-type recombinase/integrase n=1 Tax=Methylomonas sp. MK1 TaxID=1131552 RepID=UPI00037D16D3|nr:tyrosine-type recombinase/integrase [Methylomonas sp. MK1]